MEECIVWFVSSSLKNLLSSFLLLILPPVGKTSSSTWLRAETQALASTLIPFPTSNQLPCPTHSTSYLSHTFHLFSVSTVNLLVQATVFPGLGSRNSLLIGSPAFRPAPLQSILQAPVLCNQIPLSIAMTYPGGTIMCKGFLWSFSE